MTKVPQKRTPEFKLSLALEAIKAERTIVQIASEKCLLLLKICLLTETYQ